MNAFWGKLSQFMVTGEHNDVCSFILIYQQSDDAWTAIRG